MIYDISTINDNNNIEYIQLEAAGDVTGAMRGTLQYPKLRKR